MAALEVAAGTLDATKHTQVKPNTNSQVSQKATQIQTTSKWKADGEMDGEWGRDTRRLSIEKGVAKRLE